jgi:hypothetical protein
LLKDPQIEVSPSTMLIRRAFRRIGEEEQQLIKGIEVMPVRNVTPNLGQEFFLESHLFVVVRNVVY